AEMHSAAPGGPAELLASGHMSTERTFPGKPVETATARQGTAQLRPDGGWTEIALEHDVVLRQGERSARSEHALFLRDEDTATLTGKAVVRAATPETPAPRTAFHHRSGGTPAPA